MKSGCHVQPCLVLRYQGTLGNPSDLSLLICKPEDLLHGHLLCARHCRSSIFTA